MTEQRQPSAEEQRLQNLTVEFRVLEGMVGELQARIGAIDAYLRELTVAKTTIESLENLNVGDELLIPIGGSSFLRASIIDKDNVVVGIGAGITVEKPVRDAIALLDSRINEVSRARAEVERQLVQVYQRMEQVRGEVQKILGQT